MPNSICITGGAGFIGSHVTERLLAEGHKISVIDNFNDFYDPSIKHNNIKHFLDNENFKLYESDIRNSTEIEKIFKENKFDELIHLAAMAGVRPSIEDPVLYNDINLIGTMHLLEACRKNNIRKLIFASSSSVYGNNKKVPFSETDPVDNPISPYASTKKSGELMVYTYHHLYNIKSACLRFFTVYGPKQRPEMAIHLFTDKIYNGEEIQMFGDGSSMRDYTFVDDIVDGILSCRIADYKYEVFNLGRSDTIKLSELIKKIENKLGIKAKIKRLELQPGDVDQTYADTSKAKKILQYNPKVSIDIGLDKFIDWYLKNKG